MTSYDRLISRLDAFIRKYYANRVIRGSLIFLICLLLYILTVSVGEYFLYMPVWLRVSLVSVFVFSGLVAFIAWIAIPLAKMSRLGKLISHEQAATIIGEHFPEVSDKLINILQLKKQDDDHSSRQLIEASIDQKASQISVVPITTAIDLSKNKKYLRFLFPVALVGIFILVAAPNVFKEASQRLLQPTKAFEKPAPFKFVIKTLPLVAVRNSDFVLQVVTTGSVLPADMSVDLGADKVPMQVIDRNTFQYTFRNLTESVDFRLHAAGFYSQPYALKVVQKPVLKAFNLQINYPSYTGKKDEVRNSLGDMTLPVGTKVNWNLITEHTDAVTIKFGLGNPDQLKKNETSFGYQFRFMNDTDYTLTMRNNQSTFVDSYHYVVQVIPDQYPVVQVVEHHDTISGKQILLNGTAGDDYGITKVVFHYDISDGKDKKISGNSNPVKITPGPVTSFQYYFDIETLNLNPGQVLSYYIEVWDNDGVHGSKASRSEVVTYKMYNIKQLDSTINENSKQINSSLSNSVQRSNQLQTEYKDMQTKMLQSDKMEWEQQQSLKEMLDKQKQLKDQIENIKKRFEEQKKASEQKPFSDDLKEKQNQVEKQLDNLLNKELQEQMKKLQELMQKMNKENAFQTMQEMEQENKLFNMDLQRMQELMKQMEMQMRMEDMANKLDTLAQREDDLKKETDQGKKDKEALSSEQKDIKKDLDKMLQQDMKEMKQLNDKMQQKQSLKEPEKSAKDAEQNMQQSQQQLEQQQNSNASESEKKASDNLKDMAGSMRQGAGGMGLKQIEIDIKATRQILTNLIRLSFDQEDLMGKVRTTSPASQEYITNMQDQKRLYNNSLMIKDSLFSLSKRVFVLSATVNKETSELEKNMAFATQKLEDRRTIEAMTSEQYIMMHTNNLALMLNELLANLLQQQRQAMSGKSGNGSCNMPGGMKPKKGAGQQMKDIITQQTQLGDGMKKMQGGKKPGQMEGQKPGTQGKGQGKGEGQGKGDGQGQGNQGQEGNNNGEYGDAEQLARYAEQQAAIRKQLQELNSMLISKGMGGNKELKEINEKMDKNETDLLNRKLNSELFKRQQEILTHMLEVEKAIREQEQDDKRNSNAAKDISRPVPPELQKYLQDSQHLLEQYKTVPPQLKPYYRSMVDQYYQMLGHK